MSLGSFADSVAIAIGLYRINVENAFSTGLGLNYTYMGLWDYVRVEIDKGFPAMVTTPPWATSVPAHSMVVCGYRTNPDGSQEFLIHNGWYGAGNITGTGNATSHTLSYVSASLPLFAYRFHVAAGWHTDNQGNKRYLDSNKIALTGLQTIGSARYCFDSSGVMLTGWQTIGGSQYYFDPSSGVALTGLQTVGGKQYRFSSSGAMLTGRQWIDGRWYELADDGTYLGMDLNGVYTIATTLSQVKVFDITAGSVGNGALLQTYAGNRTPAQRFRFTRSSDGYFTIANGNSGKVLDIPSAQAKAGVTIQQYTPNGTDAQKWSVTPSGKGDGSVWIAPKLDQNLRLGVSGSSVANGAAIQLQAKSTTSQAQAFRLDRTVDIPLGPYTIKASYTDKVLDISGGGVTNGTNVQIYAPNGSGAQRFCFMRDDATGYYTIVNPQSFRALDVQSAGTANGTNVQIYAPNGTSAQKWDVEKASNGYRFYSVCSGLALDVSNASTANGANVQTWTPNGSAAQAFVLVPATPPLADGVYTIGATHTNKVLDINGTANGANARLWAANGTANQRFRLTYHAGVGRYSIVSLGTAAGRSLNVANPLPNPLTAANVIAGNPRSEPETAWAVEPTGEGSFYLFSTYGNPDVMVLDAASAGTADGTNVQIYNLNKTPAQKWRLTKVG